MTEVFKLAEDYYKIKLDDLFDFVEETRTRGFRFK